MTGQTALTALVFPILLSAVIVFVVSSIIHMFTPWHASDYPKLPNEDQVRQALRSLNIAPGDYMAPRPASRQDMQSEAFKQKMKEGPVFMLRMFPSGGAGMGQSLVLWFLYSIVVGVFAGYVAGRALPPGSPYLHVFRFAGVTAFIAYSVGLWQMSIWYRRPWLTTFKATVDGLLYGLLTAGTFGWLWPHM